MSNKLSRREFLRGVGIAAAGTAAAACDPLLNPRTSRINPSHGLLPVRPLGGTGEQVTLLGLGGQGAIDGGEEAEALAIIEEAIDGGINYIDTAYVYGWGTPNPMGTSERRIGIVTEHRRNEVFLATKSRSRTYSGVMSDFNTSLSRLRTDYIDLYQVHNIGTTNDVHELFEEDGFGRTAMDAFARLRDEGKTRFIGITGHHDPTQLLSVLDRPSSDPSAPVFDAVLMALNAADRHYRPFQDDLLQRAVSDNMAVIVMKVTGMNHLLDDLRQRPEVQDDTFIDGPLSGIGLMEACLRYVYSFPISCAIVGISNMAQLHEDLDIAATRSDPLSPAQRDALESMTTATPPGGPRAGDWFKIERY